MASRLRPCIFRVTESGSGVDKSTALTAALPGAAIARGRSVLPPGRLQSSCNRAVFCCAPSEPALANWWPRKVFLLVKSPRSMLDAMPSSADQPDPLKPPQDAADGEPTGESSMPAKITWPLRNVTENSEGGDRQIMGAEPPLDRPTANAEDSSEPPKKRWSPENVTDAVEGRGLQIFGWDVPERKPPPMPKESELRKVAESKHRYPDLPQAPTRDQFADTAAFNTAMSLWLVNVAPVVLRRNKFSKPRPKPGGAAGAGH